MYRDQLPPRQLPTVFTLVANEVPARYLARREWWLPDLLVFRCHADGRVTVDGFPEETDVNETIVHHVARIAPDLLWIDRERLYLHAANGEAVYIPVGPSRLPGCTRYGRLYRRLPEPRQ
jgi:hypothetical protein